MKIIVLLLFVLLQYISTNAQNVIFNSDFENWTGFFPDGWEAVGTTISPDSIMEYTTFPHGGNKACRLINRQNSLYMDTLVATQTFNFYKNHKYTIEFWLKGKGYMYINMIGIFNYLQSVDSTNWVRKSFFICKNQDYLNVKLLLRIFKTNELKDDIQIDDFKIIDEGLVGEDLDINNISALIPYQGSLFSN